MNQEKSSIFCVDPSESKPVLEFLKQNNLKLDFILNTHHHYDHTDGNYDIKKETGAKIIAYKNDDHRIKDIDIKVEGGDEIKIGEFHANIIFIPGHTLGHIAFYFKKEKMLFSGDTLFFNGCGRVFEGTMPQMRNSLEKLKSLPKDTKVYCGHEYSKKNTEFALEIFGNNKELQEYYKKICDLRESNVPTIPSDIEAELKFNPFLNCNNDLIRTRINMIGKNDDEVFTVLRELKDKF